MLSVMVTLLSTRVGTLPIGFIAKKDGFFCYSLNKLIGINLHCILPISIKALTALLGWLTMFQYKTGI